MDMVIIPSNVEDSAVEQCSTPKNVNGHVPVFRHKIDPQVIGAITGFAKIHQYDDRRDYKEAWKDWCDENRDMLDVEAKRLEAAGYTGDIYDKFFKSGRYYFRNKKLAKSEPVERRKYVGLSRDILKKMDDFIQNHTQEQDTTAPEYDISPSGLFDAFCQENKQTLMDEINVLLNDHNLSDDEISAKLKKTFKNRYFQKVRKNSN
jgi:hypothetical protein